MASGCGYGDLWAWSPRTDEIYSFTMLHLFEDVSTFTRIIFMSMVSRVESSFYK